MNDIVDEIYNIFKHAKPLENNPHYHAERTPDYVENRHLYRPTGIAQFDAMVERLKPRIMYKHTEAPAYNGDTDVIVFPLPESFDSPEWYAYTLAHEIGHWTGHDSRLARFADNVIDYPRGLEEMTAELTSLFIMDKLGMATPEMKKWVAGYLADWVRVSNPTAAFFHAMFGAAMPIKDEDAKVAFDFAVKQATKAAEYIIGE